LPFWQICLVMCLMYATVVPFNTILSAFLQARWYPGDPRKGENLIKKPVSTRRLICLSLHFLTSL
jgi:hypothetical protein